MRRGTAHLPLHGGKAPAWLFNRMKLLAREISRIMCYDLGREEFLERFSDPYWFQAFGCVLGFDWHSSGVTTTVCGALKEGLKGLGDELGLYVCGGKGGTSRKTPSELDELVGKRRVDADAEKLKYASRMSAKVDNTALQDGYQLYHHTFIVDKLGKWVVVQQGMNQNTKWARRYHWSGGGVDDFVCEPHKAICSDNKGEVVNMVAQESGEARKACAELSREDPAKVVKEYTRITELKMPARHPVVVKDIQPKNLNKILLKTYENRTGSFEDLLGTQGVGPGTIRALALMSELIYGKKPSFKDPARYSFSHGGKDGFPYPVDRKRYDTSINILKETLNKAKIGHTEKLQAFQRLSSFGPMV